MRLFGGYGYRLRRRFSLHEHPAFLPLPFAAEPFLLHRLLLLRLGVFVEPRLPFIFRGLTFQGVDNARWPWLHTNLGAPPVNDAVQPVIVGGRLNHLVVAWNHARIAEHARVLINLLNARHVHVLAELLGELVLPNKEQVGVGFCGQPLSVRLRRVAASLTRAVRIPEIEVHVTGDNRRTNLVLQIPEPANSEKPNNDNDERPNRH